MRQTSIVSTTQFEEFSHAFCNEEYPQDFFPSSFPTPLTTSPLCVPEIEQWQALRPLPRLKAEEFNWRFQNTQDQSFFETATATEMKHESLQEFLLSTPFEEVLPPKQAALVLGQTFSRNSHNLQPKQAAMVLGQNLSKRYPEVKKEKKEPIPVIKRETKSEESSIKSKPIKLPSIPIKSLSSSMIIKKEKDKLPQDVCSYNKGNLHRKVHYAVRQKKHTQGRKPKVKDKWTLMCSHCGQIFQARPTPKNSRYVVNHCCVMNGKKRKQYVIGVKTRKCKHDHAGPCMQQLLSKKQEKD